MGIMRFLAYTFLLLPALSIAGPLDKYVSRYQLVQLGDQSRNQYMIDTQSGKIWRRICYDTKPDGVECVMNVWIAEDVIDVTLTREQLHEKFKNRK